MENGSVHVMYSTHSFLLWFDFWHIGLKDGNQYDQ